MCTIARARTSLSESSIKLIHLGEFISLFLFFRLIGELQNTFFTLLIGYIFDYYWQLCSIQCPMSDIREEGAQLGRSFKLTSFCWAKINSKSVCTQ